jgi:hypothetical protein
MAGLLQLLFALAFIAFVCFVTYKITLPICLKIIDLCFESPRFRLGVLIFFAVAFAVLGIWQLKDFLEGVLPNLSRFFPLYFLISVIFVYLIYRNQKLSK